MTDITISSFQYSQSQFFDNANYPYGFSRSGDFTIKQANILTKLGRTLLGLSEGSIIAQTPEEIRFVQVCAGEIEAVTEIETLWRHYLNQIDKPFVKVS